MSRQGVVGHRHGTGENVPLAIFNFFFREENVLVPPRSGRTFVSTHGDGIIVRS